MPGLRIPTRSPASLQPSASSSWNLWPCLLLRSSQGRWSMRCFHRRYEASLPCCNFCWNTDSFWSWSWIWKLYSLDEIDGKYYMDIDTDLWRHRFMTQIYLQETPKEDAGLVTCLLQRKINTSPLVRKYSYKSSSALSSSTLVQPKPGSSLSLLESPLQVLIGCRHLYDSRDSTFVLWGNKNVSSWSWD